jgi:tetratricopeptide (TPR) repeat protein
VIDSSANNEERKDGNAAAGERRGFFRTLAGRRAVHVVLILLVGLAAYSNTFHAPFQFDDEEFIERNNVITSLDNFFSSARGYEYNSRRVLAFLTFALNYRFGGYDVTGYHVVNLAIHLINALLVYALALLTFRTVSSPRYSRFTVHASRLTAPASPLTPHPSRFTFHDSSFTASIALFPALLFAAHPVQTQAVTYISQRMTSLAAMFYLLSVALYVKARLAWPDPAPGSPAGSKPASLGYYLISVSCAICAMKTKEIAFTLPLSIALTEFVFFGTAVKKKVLVVLPVLLTLAVIPISIMGAHKPLGEILSDLGEKSRLQTDMPRWDYLMTQMRVITTYVRLLFFPIDQNLDYDYPSSHSLFDPPVFFSFLFLASIAGLGVYFLRKARRETRDLPRPTLNGPSPAWCYRLAAFGIFWFFLTLAVESSVIPIVDVIFEHRLYLPSVGAFLAMTASLFLITGKLRDRWPGSDRAGVLVLAIAVLALTTACFARNTVWQDSIRLNQDVVRKSPGKARGHANLALAYGNAGMLARAVTEFRSALRLDPGDASVYNNLGIAFHDSGLIEEAIAEYRAAIRLRPAFADAHYNLGVAYADNRQFEKAVEEYETAAKLNPDRAQVHNNLGSAYGALQLMDKAAREFQTAVELQPRYFEAHYNLGIALRGLGLPLQAREHFRIAGQLRAERTPEKRFNR